MTHDPALYHKQPQPGGNIRFPRLLCLAAVAIMQPPLWSPPALAQTPDTIGADAVVLVSPGEGGGGYGAEYFPHNVLGPPDTTAREQIPTIDPAQIYGLGIGGEIVLRFDRVVITDGPGKDLTVFENAFRYSIGITERVYAEVAEVSVSRDGLTWLAFTYDSLTLDGLAGTLPTHGNANPANPEVSGGNSFDLALLGIDSIRFVRLRDVTNIIRGNPSHPFFDPTINGFDLDAVVAVNAQPNVPSSVPSIYARDVAIPLLDLR